MVFDDLRARLEAVATVLETGGGDAHALREICRFLTAFHGVKPPDFFSAAERVLDGEAMPEPEDAMFAAQAAEELERLDPIFETWRCSKSIKAAMVKLREFFSERSEWSLRTMEVLIIEQLKQTKQVKARLGGDVAKISQRVA